MRSRAGFLVGVLVVAGLLGVVTASSVSAATKTTVTWKVSSMTAGQNEWLSDLALTNSPGVKTWSKKGSCRFLPEGYEAFLSMGTGKSCTLTLKIAKSGKYPAKTSTHTIIRAPSPATTTTVTWKISSLTAGQVKNLSDLAKTNSPGVKTWSKTGSCVLSPKSDPPKLTMGSTGSCTLTLEIAKTSKYSAKTSSKTIILALYGVGDTGPAGGTIFWVDMTRPEGSQYFEAACAGWSDRTCGFDLNEGSRDGLATWGCAGTPIIGADGTAIGTGEQNTIDMLNGCEDSALAKFADRLVLGGQSDWFVPSKDELSQMLVRREAIGGMPDSDENYLSSSEIGANLHIGENVNCYSGCYIHIQKENNGYFRPVRSF